MTRIKTAFFLVLALAASWAHAADISLETRITKDEAELGESLVYQLEIKISGQLTFSPNIEVPDFQKIGFQVRSGPQRSQSSFFNNGQVSMSWTFSWEIAPVKSGTLQLGPCRVSYKDPAKGEVTVTSKAHSVKVKKVEGLALPPTPTPLPDVVRPTGDGLRPLKGDLPLPWAKIVTIAGIFLAGLAFALWLILKPPPPKKIKVVRDPGQVALFELEQAARYLRMGDAPAYYKDCSRILREYLQHKLGQQGNLTLNGASQLALRTLNRIGAGDSVLYESERVPQRLNELIYGGQEAGEADAKLVSGGIRLMILEIENRSVAGSMNQALADLKNLDESNVEGEAQVSRLREIVSEYMSARFGEKVREDLAVERRHLEIKSIQQAREAELNKEIAAAVASLKGRQGLIASALVSDRGVAGELNGSEWRRAAETLIRALEAPGSLKKANSKEEKS